MNTKDLKYTFHYVTHCNMCGADASRHKVLGKRLNQSQGKNPRDKIGITTTVVKCTECSLIFSNPQPIPSSLQDHYGIPPESYWNADYFKITDDYFSNEIATLKKLYTFKTGDKALDIGAGVGKCLIALEKAGFESFGIEPSEPFYTRAITQMGISPERLSLASVEDAVFPQNHFDFVTFGAVLEHLVDPSNSIMKAMKWLKPGGLMQIEVPSSGWLTNKILNAFYRIKGLDYVANVSPMHEPFHLYEFSLKSFSENAKQNGYQIVHFDYFVCETYMPKMLDFFIVPFMKKTNTGMQLSVWLQKEAK